MSESPETADARRDWTLNAIGEKLAAMDIKLEKHFESDDRRFEKLENRIYGNPDHPGEPGLAAVVVDHTGSIDKHDSMLKWAAGILGTVLAGVATAVIAIAYQVFGKAGK